MQTHIYEHQSRSIIFLDSTYHNLPINLVSHFILFTPGPTEVGVKGWPILPLRVDVQLEKLILPYTIRDAIAISAKLEINYL